jgi:hypothetical protein
MSDRLKLLARDNEDFMVVAAVLQDALITQGDMTYLPDERQFVVVANRFRWENCSETAEMMPQPVAATISDDDSDCSPCSSFERVNCGIRFDGVEHVKCRNLDIKDRSRILEFLTFQIDGDAIVLLFAGDAALRLEGSAITCQIQDVGDPWPTLWRPHHAAGEA